MEPNSDYKKETICNVRISVELVDSQTVIGMWINFGIKTNSLLFHKKILLILENVGDESIFLCVKITVEYQFIIKYSIFDTHAVILLKQKLNSAIFQ